MGFQEHANRVRDPSLSHGRRLSALRSAVSHYSPLGFNPTWAYICAAATTDAEPEWRIRRDEAVLLRALELLESSRSMWLQELRGFAAHRRREKAAGMRAPSRVELRRLERIGWPGADTPSTSGLVAAVAHRRAELASWPLATTGDSRAGPTDAGAQVNILECAATYVREGALDAGGLSVLRATIAELEAALRRGFSSLNQKRLWMLRMAELVEFAATASAGEPSRESRS